jgi:hypothetical protein
MFKILSTYICWKNIYKVQYLEGSGTPVLYIGRTVLQVTDVSGQPIGPIFKGQAVKEER